MNQRACVKCNTRWTLAAASCPFCGGDSVEVSVPPSAWAERRPEAPPVPAPTRRARWDVVWSWVRPRRGSSSGRRS